MPDPFVHFKVMVKERASDLILREGERPAIRVEGKIRFLTDDRFTAEEAEALLSAILSPVEIGAFRVVMEEDVAFVALDGFEILDEGPFEPIALEEALQVWLVGQSAVIFT